MYELKHLPILIIVTFLLSVTITIVASSPDTEVRPIPVSAEEAIPLPSPTPSISPSPTATPSAKPTPKPQKWEGKASYYSLAGCIGCRADRKMANGEVLDDTKLTVAFNRAKLNRFVRVTNKATGESVVAKVSDTGGFERHGKIIDLSVATKDAINCPSTCNVTVELI